jgi:hypothetical protein
MHEGTQPSCCLFYSRHAIRMHPTAVPSAPRILRTCACYFDLNCVQNMASTHAKELGMQTVPSLNIAYTQEKGYVTADIADKENLTKLNLSGACLCHWVMCVYVCACVFYVLVFVFVFVCSVVRFCVLLRFGKDRSYLILGRVLFFHTCCLHRHQVPRDAALRRGHP